MKGIQILAAFSSLALVLAGGLAAAQEATAPAAPAAAQPGMPGQDTMGLERVSDVMGMDVTSAQGDELGEISDMIYDPDSGRVVYMILSAGGFLGLGERLYAIPAQALQPQAGEDRLVLNIDRDKLKAAPAFERGTWPDIANREWGTQVHEYYGVTPYWETSEAEVTVTTEPAAPAPEVTVTPEDEGAPSMPHEDTSPRSGPM